MNELYLTLNGFKFNNKHNHDLEVVMQKRTIQAPTKKKIKESVPFMNGNYDFSTVATNGEINYDEREIEVVLGLPAKTKMGLQTMYSNVVEWLMNVGKSQLIFDDMSDSYYMAEVEKISNFDEVMSFGMITATFVAEPFKKSIEFVGNEPWDTFNFETDIIQDVQFHVVNNLTVSIYNPGLPVVPVVNVDAVMNASLDGYTANFKPGDNTDYKFKLKSGVNSIFIGSSGNIKFIFRKVRI
jgi:predicted phage tail component-like protein